MAMRKHRQTKKIMGPLETPKQILYTKVQTHLMISQKSKLSYSIIVVVIRHLQNRLKCFGAKMAKMKMSYKSNK